MTQETFSKIKFKANMKARYRDAEYNVVSVNFHESLLGLGDDNAYEEGDLIWVRCENCELIND